MKRKIILILLAIMILIVILGFSFFTSAKNTSELGLVKTNLKAIQIEEKIIKGNEELVKDLKLNNEMTISQYAKKHLSKLGINNTIEGEVEYLDNVKENIKEIAIRTEKGTIKLNAETGQLSAYSSQNVASNLPKTNKNEEQIEEIAWRILNRLKDNENDKYEILYIEKFDEEIWTVGFAKKYEELINKGEQIRFAFSPETEEIITLGQKFIKYANNEVKITEKQAKKIGEIYLKNSVADDMEMTINIVVPNEMFYNNLEPGEIRVEPLEARKAYICEFNNEGNTKIYIDCTTGEVLGGELELGKEF